jgi:hypothetical protein
MEAFDLRRNAVIVIGDGVQLLDDGGDGRVVMSNKATARRFCTCGNNEVLLRHFFPTQLLLC